MRGISGRAGGGRIEPVEWHRAVSFVKAKSDATADPLRMPRSATNRHIF